MNKLSLIMVALLASCGSNESTTKEKIVVQKEIVVEKEEVVVVVTPVAQYPVNNGTYNRPSPHHSDTNSNTTIVVYKECDAQRRVDYVNHHCRNRCVLERVYDLLKQMARGCR